MRTELRREVGGTLFLDSGAGHVLLWQVVEESAKLFRYLISATTVQPHVRHTTLCFAA